MEFLLLSVVGNYVEEVLGTCTMPFFFFLSPWYVARSDKHFKCPEKALNSIPEKLFHFLLRKSPLQERNVQKGDLAPSRG